MRKQAWLARLAPPSSIPKNSAWLLGAFLAQKGCALVIFVLLARHLGTTGFGSLAFVIAFGAILAQATELGVNVLLVRRVAVEKREAGALLGTALGIKVLTSVAALGLGALLLPLLGRAHGLALPAMLVLGGALTEQVSRAICAVFVGYEKMEFEASFLAGRAITTLVLVVAVVLLDGSLAAVAAAFWLAELVVLGLGLVIYQGRFAGSSLALRWNLVKPLLREALPIGAASAFGIVYFHADRILLWTIRGPEQAGVYDAAYRVLSALMVIPLIAGRAAYPVLSRAFGSEGAEARTVMSKLLKVLLVLALPIGVGGMMLAENLMVLLYGESYRSGAAALGIVLVANGLIFLSWVPKTALLAAKRGREFFLVSSVTTIANLVANLILIPRFGATGAAASTVLSEGLALGIVYRYASRILPNLRPPPFLLTKALVATALMVLTVTASKGGPLPLQVAAGAVVYLGAVAAFRLIGLQDLSALAALKPHAAARPMAEPD